MAESVTPLAGRVALITGAAQRIGAEIARTLHREGMDLALHYRSSAVEAEDLAMAGAAPPRAPSCWCGRTSARRRGRGLREQAVAFRGHLDLWSTMPPASTRLPSITAGVAQLNDFMGSNLKGPFFLALAAAPWLRASGGAIVNLVDIHAERPLKDHSIYCMAKAGNAMMVRALARDLGPAVRVNGVAPGAILWPEQGMGEETQRQILARTALGRPGTAADVARAVLFLARDADYVTGQIINVDGGRTIQQ